MPPRLQPRRCSEVSAERDDGITPDVCSLHEIIVALQAVQVDLAQFQGNLEALHQQSTTTLAQPFSDRWRGEFANEPAWVSALKSELVSEIKREMSGLHSGTADKIQALESALSDKAPQSSAISRGITWMQGEMLTSASAKHTFDLINAINAVHQTVKRASTVQTGKAVLLVTVDWFKEFVASRKVPTTVLARLVQSRRFFWLFNSIVLLNACWLGHTAEQQMLHQQFARQRFVRIVNICFFIWFCAEASVKIVGLRWAYFFGRGWKWNFLDLLAIAASVPDIVAPGDASNILAGARMLRLLRILRVVKLFPELEKMLFILFRTSQTLLWVGVLLIFFMYCSAVMLMQSVSVDIHKCNLQHCDQVRHRYGTLYRACMTLFHALTGGDWAILVAPLERMWGGYKTVFAAYMFFMTIGVLNVVIGTFCEEAAAAVEENRSLRTERQRCNDESFRKEMCKVFREIDKEQVGEVNESQFSAYINDDNAGTYLKSYGIDTRSPKDLFRMMDHIDGTPNGLMDIGSFVATMEQLAGNARGTDVVLMRRSLHDLKKWATMILSAQLGRDGMDMLRSSRPLLFEDMPVPSSSFLRGAPSQGSLGGETSI